MRFLFILTLVFLLATSCRADQASAPHLPRPARTEFPSATIAQLRAAAENGNAEALSILSHKYAQGDGVRQDYVEAYKWFTIYATAPLSDGPMYKIKSERDELAKKMTAAQIREGTGRAEESLQRRANRSDLMAQYALGRIYETGLGLTQDYKEAYFWYLLPFIAGHETLSNSHLVQIALHLTTDEITALDKRASLWYRTHPKAAASHRTKGIDDVAVMAWASSTAAQALTFTFDDYTSAFAKAKRHFTTEGWESFQHSLDESKLQEYTIKYQQKVCTDPSVIRSPKIESTGIEDGGRQWTVSVPMIQTIEAGNKKSWLNRTVTMTLVEKPSILGPTLSVVGWAAK